jgi:hypothetical protein
VAWLLLLLLLVLLLLSLPLDRVGELSVPVVFVWLCCVDVDVLVVVAESAACAATPTATVPATLAATNAPVISDVRRIPVSRFMCVAPLSLTTQRSVPSGSRSGLCGSWAADVKVSLTSSRMTVSVGPPTP